MSNPEPNKDAPDDDLFDEIVEEGALVAYQDWDSGGPGEAPVGFRYIDT